MNKLIISTVAVVALMVLCIILLLNTCEKIVEIHEQESGKTLIESMGEKVREAQDDFNKGYEKDSTDEQN